MINFNDFVNAINASKKNENSENKNLIIPQVKTPEKKETVLIQNPANTIISKGKLATSIVVTAAISAALMYGVGRLRIGKLQNELEKVRKQLSSINLQETLDKLNAAQKNVQDLTKKSETDQKTIAALQERLNNLISGDSFATPPKVQDIAEQVEKKASKYRKKIEGLTSIYEDSTAPEFSTSVTRLGNIKSIPYAQSTLPMTPKKPEIFIQGLLSDLKSKDRVEIPLKITKSAPEQIEEACIKPDTLRNLDIFEDTNIELSYGKKVGWSKEKVARDILQNFYDGNNHTLDGVGLLVEKTGDSYRIRISGNGVFRHERLLRFGNTTKDGDLFEAGGFGEGAKIVYTNLLANNSTKQIHYRSADWELTFDSANEVIRKKISKTPQVLDGNYIEFETQDEGLAQSIIKAFNYFRHSNNADFQNLTYDSPDFGFRILEPGKKGNFYLTQRFEYGEVGAWEDSVDGLDIIFKRKPAPEVYEKYAHKKFNTGRDRSKMEETDIYELTKCFAQDMSDDDILQSILATQKHWINFGTANKNPLHSGNADEESDSIFSFLKALCETAEKKGLTIDFSKLKICLKDNDYIKPDQLKSLGYTVIDSPGCGLDLVGMPKASRIIEELKQHKAIPPTPAEAKKLKILEEAIRVIQENFEMTYITKLKELFGHIAPKDILKGNRFLSNEYSEKFLSSLPAGIVEKTTNPRGIEVYEIKNTSKFAEELHKFYSQLINNLNTENFKNEENTKMINDIISSISFEIGDNPFLRQIYFQLKNLEIISRTDIEAPRFIFDRKQELASSTLGEAIIDWFDGYKGHWIDKTYLDTGNFYELIATWIHEICHKSGGDGTAEFTYKLTDIIESLMIISAKSPEYRSDLLALQKVFEEIK